ncbi:hypothetical protein Q7P37_002351 [Cladosporium fusiforme]
MPPPATAVMNAFRRPTSPRDGRADNTAQRRRSCSEPRAEKKDISDAPLKNTSSESFDHAKTPAVEDPPLDIPLLGPVPKNFSPAYDYLGTVKLLADEIRPGLYESLFADDIFEQERPWGVEIWDSGSMRVSPTMRSPITYKSIGRYRQFLKKPPNQQREPHVVIVQAVDKAAIQAFGMALDIDPRFFALHLVQWSYEVYYPPDWGHGMMPYRDAIPDSDLALLSDRYANFLRLSQQADFSSRQTERMGLQAASPIHLAGSNPLQPQATQSTPGADPPHSIKTPGEGAKSPFHLSSMLRFGHGLRASSNCETFLPWRFSLRHPEGTLTFDLGNALRNLCGHDSADTTARDLLFRSDNAHKDIVHFLPRLMAIDAWSHNVSYLSNRLNMYRHEAIANPSLKTFYPLTLLRRNLAHMDDALNLAKSYDSHCNLKMDQMQQDRTPQDEESVMGLCQILRARYDALLSQVDATSTLLNNEIQLVIGSDSAIMKEDSAIMKEQARRATLLTILAAIYLPLSLVTGIFGMNIWEINQGTPRFWACMIALLMIGGATAAAVFGYMRWRRARDAEKGESRTKEDDGYKLA